MNHLRFCTGLFEDDLCEFSSSSEIEVGGDPDSLNMDTANSDLGGVMMSLSYDLNNQHHNNNNISSSVNVTVKGNLKLSLTSCSSSALEAVSPANSDVHSPVTEITLRCSGRNKLQCVSKCDDNAVDADSDTALSEASNIDVANDVSAVVALSSAAAVPTPASSTPCTSTSSSAMVSSASGAAGLTVASGELSVLKMLLQYSQTVICPFFCGCFERILSSGNSCLTLSQ